MKQSSKLIAQRSALWRGAMKKLLHLFLSSSCSWMLVTYRRGATAGESPTARVYNVIAQRRPSHE